MCEIRTGPSNSFCVDVSQMSSRAVCWSLLPCSHISLWKPSICHSLLLSRSCLQLSEEILISSLKCNAAEANKVFWEEQLQRSHSFEQKKQSSNTKSPQDLQSRLSFIQKHHENELTDFYSNWNLPKCKLPTYNCRVIIVPMAPTDCAPDSIQINLHCTFKLILASPESHWP